MRRALALLCAAVLLAGLCFACGKKAPDPGKETTSEAVTLLTLYTDTQPLRIVTQEKNVTVTLQLLEHESTLDFLRPIADEWEETLIPGKEYTIDKEIAIGTPEYRLFVRQGKNIALHNLTSMGFEGNEVFELEGRPWAPAPIDRDSPMVHLCRMAAIAPGGEEYDYWHAFATAIGTLRSVDLDMVPDGEGGFYRVPEWLFEAYAAALFPGVDVPALDGGESEYVSYHPETAERWWVREDYSTWLWAEFKSVGGNRDGSLDVTILVTAPEEEWDWEMVIKVAPNKAYDPDSPFEYHLVGLPMEPDRRYGLPEGQEYDEFGDPYDDDDDYGGPPPDFVVGTWRAPAKRGHAAWLEIYPDGKAGLYLGSDDSGQIYEIYSGYLGEAFPDGPGQISVHIDFGLDWYIYESEDGPITGVPDSYSGIYMLRHAWEGDQQVLYVTAGMDADYLFGKEELKLLWVPKTLQGDCMIEMEAFG